MSKVLRLVLLVALACGAFALAACGDEGDGGGGGGGETTSATAPAEDASTGELPDDPEAAEFETIEAGSGDGLTLGYISIGESLPFAKLLSDSVRAAAEEAGARLVFCDAAFDAAKALDCAKNFKTQGVDGYASSNYDAAAARQICAAGPDVPVIAVAIRQDPCAVAFMGGNDDRSGLIAGVAMGEYLQSEFDCEYDAVISLESPAVGDANTKRAEGWRRGLEDVCGPLRNARTYDTDATTEGGRRVFTDVLTSLPGAERVVVFPLNDDLGLGAIAAADAQGRTDNVLVAGQGADTSVICELKNNPQWVGDTAYFPEQWGYSIVPNLIRLVRGETVRPNLFVPHVFVNASNVDDYYNTTDCA